MDIPVYWNVWSDGHDSNLCRYTLRVSLDCLPFDYYFLEVYRRLCRLYVSPTHSPYQNPHQHLPYPTSRKKVEQVSQPPEKEQTDETRAKSHDKSASPKRNRSKSIDWLTDWISVGSPDGRCHCNPSVHALVSPCLPASVVDGGSLLIDK